MWFFFFLESLSASGRDTTVVVLFLPACCISHIWWLFFFCFLSQQWTLITQDLSPNGPEQLTPGSRFWSLKRSFILTGIWPGGGGLRLHTLFVCPKGRSKSGFKIDGWNGRKTTNYPTPRADLHQPPAICKAFRRITRLISQHYKTWIYHSYIKLPVHTKRQRLHLTVAWTDVVFRIFLFN